MSAALLVESEAQAVRPSPRGLRAATNFARMVSGLVLGLWLVRLLLTFGSDACAVVLLLVSGGGLCAILQNLVWTSIMPVLALAHHAGSERQFRGKYASASVVCASASAVALVGFCLLGALLDRLQIPSELLAGARWFVAAKAIQTLVVLNLGPRITMYLVQGRMAVYNLCLATERFADVASALLVMSIAPSSPSTAIALFGVFSATSHCVALTTEVVLASGPRTASASRWQDATWADLKDILRSVRGNSAVVLATALYARFDMVLLNLTGGLFANLVFSLAVQLSGYVRVMTQGHALGIETAAARNVSRHGGSPANLKGLIQTSSRQQAMLFFPLLLLLAVLALPIGQVWIGPRVAEPERTTSTLAVILRLMLLGMAARAVTEGWMRILNGAGYIHPYARRVLLGAVVNVLVVGSASWLVPGEQVVHFVAIVYTVLHVIVHLTWVPLLLKQTVDMRLVEVFSPLVRPLAVTVGCLPLLSTALLVEQWTVVSLGLVAGVYLFGYGVVSCWVTLTASEREWMWRLTSLRRERVALSPVYEHGTRSVLQPGPHTKS